MLVDCMVDAAVAEFKQNLRSFCETADISGLTPESAEQVSEALQRSLSQAGLAAYRAFVENFESKEDIVSDADGEVYRFNAVRNRAFMTVFGKLTIARRCYQNKSDTKSYVPLDSAWGMEGQYMTPQVREAVLFSCALITPEETVQMLEKCAPFHPDATTIKREVRRTGEQIAAHRASLDVAIKAEEPVPADAQAVVVSADGTTVLMNEKGVHFGRVAERPGGSKPGEAPTAYRMAMVGCVSHYAPPAAEDEKPRRLRSRYVAHMPETGCPSFKKLLEAEVDDAIARAPADAARILLLDGSRELWAYFNKDPRYNGYHRCIDFWHAAEHLSSVAEALFGAGKKAEQWYEKYRHILRHSDDGALRICRSIDYYAKQTTHNKTDEKHIHEHRTYFQRNGDRMIYATFEANGWPVGSGPMEAACKTLVKTRLCRSGMRWTRPGGQNILDLRTYVKSNRWETAWKQIKNLKAAA